MNVARRAIHEETRAAFDRGCVSTLGLEDHREALVDADAALDDATLKRDRARGNAADTRGTAFVVYEDIYDAKNAVDHLSGFNVCGRYLVVLFYQQTKMQKRLDTEREAAELAEMRRRLGIDGGDAGATLHKAT